MIYFSILPIFFTAIFFLAISLGPDLVLISTYSSTKGFNAGLMISIGVFSAGLLQTLLVAFGLGQLMQSIPMLAYAIKIVGALYLSYLGIKMLQSWYRNNLKSGQIKTTENLTNVSLINKGFLNNLLNPKALLFFNFFLPQFTTGDGSLSVQILILGIMLSCFALLVNCAFSITFSKFGKLVGDKLNLGRHIDGLLGIIFLGLATRLATSK
ncbi:LysE family translocator [Colwellia psychrerythraea]|uniref:Lysine exporter protein (LYSE/YGGA) n=1 Tax=Colwellia psychrerythraea TaxID=28229 RepID=A0A099KTA0_COLPS|nr:LysE family translocator [Colwellia psychrerythraea]KGJ93756.1 Lysine exporter protein (LYSE/YGGA) [Colwellia psychrerythraea]